MTSESGMMYADDGNLYGMTIFGGQYNDGVLFRFNPTTLNYTIMHQCIDSLGAVPGHGNLMQGKDHKLYGSTQTGGRYGSAGTLFSFDISNNTFTTLHKFTAQDGFQPNNPLVQAANGKLYGMCNQGGHYNYGNLFSYDITDSLFTELFAFNDTLGATPETGLTLGTNGKLYGTLSKGGAHKAGIIFSYDITNSLFTDLYDCDSATGYAPIGQVMEEMPQQIALPTGITNARTNNILVMPNPAHNQIMVTGLAQGQIAGLYNYLGEKISATPVTETDNTTHQFNIAMQPEGVYMVQILNSDGSLAMQRKIIKAN
jgi:uncharacterized repeat protein (TIGR03803 family)